MNREDAARDERLLAALRHAPDRDLAPPAPLDAAILAEARRAAQRPAAAVRAPAGTRAGPTWAERLSAWLTPSRSGAFVAAGLMVMTVSIWWGQPTPPAVDTPVATLPPPSARAVGEAASAAPAGVPQATALQAPPQAEAPAVAAKAAPPDAQVVRKRAPAVAADTAAAEVSSTVKVRPAAAEPAPAAASTATAAPAPAMAPATQHPAVMPAAAPAPVALPAPAAAPAPVPATVPPAAPAAPATGARASAGSPMALRLDAARERDGAARDARAQTSDGALARRAVAGPVLPGTAGDGPGGAWQWRRADGAPQAMGAAQLQALAALDAAANGRWRRLPTPKGPDVAGVDDREAVQWWRDGRLRALLRFEDQGVRIEDAPAGAGWRAALPTDVLQALRQAFAP